MGCNNTILSFSLKILFKQMPTNWPLWIPKTWRIKNQAYFVMCWVVAREYNMFNYKCICITLITPCLFVCLCAVVNLSLFECSNCYFYKLKNCVQRKNIFWPFWHQNRLSGYYDTTNTTKQYPNILRCLRCIAYKHQPNSTQLNSTQPSPSPTQSNSTEPIYLRQCIAFVYSIESDVDRWWMLNTALAVHAFLAVAQTWLLSVLRAYDAQLLHRQCCKWFSFNWILFVVAHAVHNAL